MAAKMLLTKPELDAVIIKLDNCATSLGSLVTKIDGIMGQLEADWSGAAQIAYASAYEQIKLRTLLPVKQLLESYPETLRQASKELDFEDNDNASTIRTTYGGILS